VVLKLYLSAVKKYKIAKTLEMLKTVRFHIETPHLLSKNKK